MSRWRAGSGMLFVVLAFALHGCASSPSSRLGGPDATGAASIIEIPIVGDTLVSGVPIPVALGGVVTVGPYTMTVPANAFDRDIIAYLDVRPGDGALQFSRTPANAVVLGPSKLSVSLAGVPSGQFGNWALYRWSEEKSTWHRLTSSMLEPATSSVSAFVTEEGIYRAMPWSLATPEADTLVTRMAVGFSGDAELRCGHARLFMPAGALRGAGDIEMTFERKVNVLHLEIHPAELNGFSVPAELTLDVSHLDLADRRQAVVGWYNPTTGLWEEVAGSRVDVENGTVTAPLQHFSSYSVILQGKAGWGQLPGGGRQLTD